MIEFTITDDFLKIFEDIFFSVNEIEKLTLCVKKKRVTIC